MLPHNDAIAKRIYFPNQSQENIIFLDCHRITMKNRRFSEFLFTFYFKVLRKDITFLSRHLYAYNFDRLTYKISIFVLQTELYKYNKGGGSKC